jgi:hypothetical protein
MQRSSANKEAPLSFLRRASHALAERWKASWSPLLKDCDRSLVSCSEQDCFCPPFSCSVTTEALKVAHSYRVHGASLLHPVRIRVMPGLCGNWIITIQDIGWQVW